MLRVISLGAGVQSSTMALMFAAGKFEPMPDCAIFADTGAEPGAVYDWLSWLETQLPFPVHRVMQDAGLERNIIESIDGGQFAGAPFFTETARGDEGRLRRQCTREFKIQPIVRKMRELVGLAKGERAPRGATLATQYIGISWDESQRMKPSRDPWIVHEFPLIDRRMTRGHCLEWMAAQGFPRPPRSACVWCPYHSDAEWRDLRDTPAEWQRVLDMDERIRGGVRGTTERLYLHRTLRPLAEVDLASAEDRGQQTMFGDECEGMCGV